MRGSLVLLLWGWCSLEVRRIMRLPPTKRPPKAKRLSKLRRPTRRTRAQVVSRMMLRNQKLTLMPVRQWKKQLKLQLSEAKRMKLFLNSCIMVKRMMSQVFAKVLTVLRVMKSVNICLMAIMIITSPKAVGATKISRNAAITMAKLT